MTARLDPISAPPVPFSTLMREASRREHEEAETTPFGSALVAGELPIDAYAALLGQTYLIYTVLEEAAEAQRHHPIGSAFYFPELLRLPHLQHDLEFLMGLGWEARLTALPATERYRERVRAMCFDWPGGFVAHQYTRYLGDLSGGQIIRRTLSNVYGLTDDGVRFYVFDEIPKPKLFKDAYRAWVDAAPWDEVERANIVAEIRTAFRLNTGLFHDLHRDRSWQPTT